MPTNDERADAASDALDRHSEHFNDDQEDTATRVCDLICNLLHLADRDGVFKEQSPGDLIERAMMHFHAEQAGE